MKKELILCLLLGWFGPVLGQVQQEESKAKTDSLRAIVIAKLRASRPDTGRITLLLQLSKVPLSQSKFDSAYSLLRQALHLAQQSRQPQYLGLVYQAIGDYHSHSKQSRYYIAASQKAAYFFQKAEKVPEATRIMVNIAREFAVNFEQAKSVEQCMQNLAYAQQTGHYEMASHSYALLYTIHMNFGQKEKAFADLMGLKKMAGRYPTTENKYLAYANLAEWYDDQKEYKRALIYHKRISAMDIKDGDSLAIVESYHCIATDLIRLGELRKAEEYLRRGMRVIDKQKPVSPNFYLTLAHLREAQNQWKKALKAASTALALARQTFQPFIIQSSLEKLARIQEKQGKYREALLTTHQLQAVSDSINKISHLRAINDIEARFALEKKDKDIRALRQAALIQRHESENDQQQQILYIILAAGLALLLVLMSWVVRQDRRRLRLLKEQKAKITAQAKRLEELNQVKDKLFSLIGHDLRSPVINLKLIIDGLAPKRESTEWPRPHTNQLQQTINSLYYTLDNLLHWASTQKEGMIVERRAISPRELATETLDLFEAMVEQKNIRIELDIPHEAYISADEGMFQVVLRNILHNALKFTPVGGWIRISLEALYVTETVLQITDNGIGINPQEVGQNAGIVGEKGTGLGLLVCKEFMEQMEGRMVIRSSPGGGTTVQLIFPSLDHTTISVFV